MILGDTTYRMGRPSIISVKEGPKRELMRITANPDQGPENGTVWEVERGIEGTTPQSFTTAATIEEVFTVGGIQNNFSFMLGAGLRTQFPGNGKLFLQFDFGWQFGIYNSGWNKFAPIFDVVEVNEAGFSWVNQGAATLTTTDGASEISASGSSGEDVHMRVQSVSASTPTTPPYDLTWAFMPTLTPVDQSSCGFIFRDSSSGKFIFFRLLYDSGSSLTKSDLAFSIDKFDSATSFNSNYTIASANLLRSAIYWFRLRDNGSGPGTLEFLVSGDGKNYRQIFSVSRTDFLTSIDQFGYAVNSNVLTGKAEMNVLNFWKRATS